MVIYKVRWYSRAELGLRPRTSKLRRIWTGIKLYILSGDRHTSAKLEAPMSLHLKLTFLAISFAVWFPLTSLSTAKADALSIVYTSTQNQTATVGSTFTAVIFTGYVINNTNAPISFQLTGGPEPFEPYVASFIDGIGYPGITLGGGQSTGVIDLAIINLQPFDSSLVYPGMVNLVLDAILIDPATGRVGGTITENNASIKVQAVVPEPSKLSLLAIGLLLICIIGIVHSSHRRNADANFSEPRS